MLICPLQAKASVACKNKNSAQVQEISKLCIDASQEIKDLVDFTWQTASLPVIELVSEKKFDEAVKVVGRLLADHSTYSDAAKLGVDGFFNADEVAEHDLRAVQRKSFMSWLHLLLSSIVGGDVADFALSSAEGRCLAAILRDGAKVAWLRGQNERGEDAHLQRLKGWDTFVNVVSMSLGAIAADALTKAAEQTGVIGMAKTIENAKDYAFSFDPPDFAAVKVKDPAELRNYEGLCATITTVYDVALAIARPEGLQVSVRPVVLKLKSSSLVGALLFAQLRNGYETVTATYKDTLGAADKVANSFRHLQEVLGRLREILADFEPSRDGPLHGMLMQCESLIGAAAVSFQKLAHQQYQCTVSAMVDAAGKDVFNNFLGRVEEEAGPADLLAVAKTAEAQAFKKAWLQYTSHARKINCLEGMGFASVDADLLAMAESLEPKVRIAKRLLTGFTAAQALFKKLRAGETRADCVAAARTILSPLGELTPKLDMMLSKACEVGTV